MRRGLSILVIASILGLVAPAGAVTDPTDSLAAQRVRVAPRLVGLAESQDGGRVDLSANGQFVLFDRAGAGIGVFDTQRDQTVVLGGADAAPFAVSDRGEVVLYTSGGAPQRWERASATSEPLPWSGGEIVDMATSQSGAVIVYAERRSGRTDAIIRVWTSERVRSFAGDVGETPSAEDRTVFITSSGRTALFRSGGGMLSVDTSTGLVQSSSLAEVRNLSRNGLIQALAGSGDVRFTYTSFSTGETLAVEYPGPSDPVVLSGDGATVIFGSRVELYRWRDGSPLTYLQPAGSQDLGRPRDASINGRFVLLTRPGATRGIVELVDLGGPDIPIVATAQLAGPQLSDQIRRLYLAYFGREPDGRGLQHWMVARAQGLPIEGVSAAFALSTEFQNTYGNLTDPEFVDLVYQNVLGRDAEEPGRTFWIGQLRAGMGRGEVMTAFSESLEFRLRTGTSSPGPVQAHRIGRLYRAYFDRQADQGGLDFWLEQFANGASLSTLSDSFAQSTEFQNTYGSLDDAGFVDLVYSNVLGRAAEEPGRSFWIDSLTSGTLSRGAVMIGFSESAEFVVRTDTIPPGG